MQYRGSVVPPYNTDSRFEPIGDIAIPAGLLAPMRLQLPTPNGNLPMDRFLYALQLDVQLRLTNAVAAELAVNVDAPYSLLNRITIEGFHKVRKQTEAFIDLRGPDLHHLLKYYQGCEVFDQSTTPLGTVLGNTNDINFSLQVPFCPLNVHPMLAAGYLLDAPNYSQLNMTIQLGDLSTLFTTGVGSTETIGNFLGNAAFPPRIRVSGYFALAGPSEFRNFVPGRLWRHFREVTGTAMTTTANNVRLVDIPRGHRMRAIMLKTGVRAVTTGGLDAYLTTGDAILSEVRVNRGLNHPVRRYTTFWSGHAEQVFMKRMLQGSFRGLPAGPATIYPTQTGYLMMDFCPKGHMNDILDLRGLTAGATGDVDSYIEANVVGAANQGMVAVFEELRDEPRVYGA